MAIKLRPCSRAPNSLSPTFITPLLSPSSSTTSWFPSPLKSGTSASSWTLPSYLPPHIQTTTCTAFSHFRNFSRLRHHWLNPALKSCFTQFLPPVLITTTPSSLVSPPNLSIDSILFKCRARATSTHTKSPTHSKASDHHSRSSSTPLPPVTFLHPRQKPTFHQQSPLPTGSYLRLQTPAGGQPHPSPTFHPCTAPQHHGCSSVQLLSSQTLELKSKLQTHHFHLASDCTPCNTLYNCFNFVLKWCFSLLSSLAIIFITIF